MEWNSTSCNA
jgi:hypothetical protein